MIQNSLLYILREESINEARKYALLDIAKLLGYDEETIYKIRKLLAMGKSIDQVIERLKRLRERYGD